MLCMFQHVRPHLSHADVVSIDDDDLDNIAASQIRMDIESAEFLTDNRFPAD